MVLLLRAVLLLIMLLLPLLELLLLLLLLPGCATQPCDNLLAQQWHPHRTACGVCES
jgi:hypothetical protein